MARLSPLERTHPVRLSSLHWVSGRIQVSPGNLRVLVQIPKCWSRRSSLLSGLSQRRNSEFFDQRFTRKNGSLGECCSLSSVACCPCPCERTPAVCGRSLFRFDRLGGLGTGHAISLAIGKFDVGIPARDVSRATSHW